MLLLQKDGELSPSFRIALAMEKENWKPFRYALDKNIIILITSDKKSTLVKSLTLPTCIVVVFFLI